ncbi:MAG: TauD/TfdA family dioxygenase, partial [Rhodospirillaceae bacterium]|nr:TauD/TfdA family dioxygenase [Rhodospirillaceae bacterium]
MATRLADSGTITVTKLHPAIGAEISGVDLSQPLDDGTIGKIQAAWHDHTVLLFRDQTLSEDDQIRFAAHFGPVADRVAPVLGDQLDAPDWGK